MQKSNYTTRSGRTVVAPSRFADTVFLPGSNNKYTKGRLVDRSFSSFGRHTDNYVHTYTPRVLNQKEQKELLDSFLQDDDWVDEQVIQNDNDDPEWKPSDAMDDGDDETDEDLDDEVDDDDDDDWEGDEPEDDVLTDGDYESDGQEDEESENEEEWDGNWVKRQQPRNERIQLEVRGRAIRRIREDEDYPNPTEDECEQHRQSAWQETPTRFDFHRGRAQYTTQELPRENKLPMKIRIGSKVLTIDVVDKHVNRNKTMVVDEPDAERVRSIHVYYATDKDTIETRFYK